MKRIRDIDREYPEAVVLAVVLVVVAIVAIALWHFGSTPIESPYG